MNSFTIILLVVSSVLIFTYSICIFRIYRNLRNEIKYRAEITGQRERIENKIYALNDILLSDIDRLYDSNKLVLGIPEKDLTIRENIPNYSFFESFGMNINNIQVKKRTIFCAMPFNKKFDPTYSAIKSACQIADYECSRSDEKFDPGNILRDILDMMAESELIIAVLDGKNPNVFYEIGIAHSIGKTVILVCNMNNLNDVSFNLSSERVLLYSSYNDLRARLISCLKNLHYV